MAKNFPNLGKESDIQVQESQKAPNKMNPERSTPKYILINIVKVKDKDRFQKQNTKTTCYIHARGTP